MADSYCEAGVLTNGANILDLVINNGQGKQVATSYSHNLACVLCGATAASAACHLKVLPCLHITCHDCLLQYLLDKSLLDSDTNFSASIFACPRCLYAIQLPRDGAAGLNDASFLQTVDSSVVISDAAKSDVQLLSDGAGCRHTSSTPNAINCGAGDGDVTDVSLSLDGLPQSLLDTKDSEDISLLLKQTGSSKHVAAVWQVSSMSVEKRSHCDASGDGGRSALNKPDVVTGSQIRSLSLDTERRQRDCERAMLQTKLAAHDLDARKSALCHTIGQRTDYLCKLIYSRRDQLLDELEKEHSQSSAVYSERINAVGAYSRSLEDSRQFADAVLAAKDVPAEVERDVVARLNQLLLSDTLGLEAHSDLPQITAMRLDIPDARHEESFVDKLFGGLVKGTVGSVEFLTSFNTDLRWPTGFVVTRGHDSVLAGKAGAFADEGQVLFYDCHGACVQRHTLPAGHLSVDVVAVESGDVLVSDVSGRVTKFTSSGQLVAEWSDMFQGPSGHMAVNSHNVVLITSAGERCVHRYSELDGQRLATFSLQWPDDGSETPPDITGITVNSNDEIIVVTSNLRNPYLFTSDGRFLHGCSTNPTADEDVKMHVENGLNSASVALPSAVCCDSFDNVLVADFLGNCVHLMSCDGRHLGRLLTKTHGVACPNFITLDRHGRLYVGQYGGDVLVFRYLSCVKHV